MLRNRTFLFVALLFCYVNNAAFSQKDDGASLDVNYINSKFSFSPTEGLLPTSTTFRSKNSISVRYLSFAEVAQHENPNYYKFPAKYKGDESADYTFEIVFNFKNFIPVKDIPTQKSIDIPPAPPTNMSSSKQVNTLKRSFELYYEGALNIYKKGEKEPFKHVVINNGKKAKIFILEKSNITGQPTDYFTTAKELDMISETTLGRMYEAKMIQDCTYKSYKVIDALYRDISYKESGLLCFVKKKRRKFDYSDFDKAYDDYKLAMKASINKNQGQADSLILSSTKTFETLLNSKEPRIDSNMQMALKIDLAWCYYWQKEFAKSRQFIDEAKTPLKDYDSYGESIVESLSYRLQEVSVRDKIKNSSCDLTEIWQ